MLLTPLLLALLPVSLAVNEQCSYRGGFLWLTTQRGVCVPTSECRSAGGTFKAGHCPGPSDIQCCTKGNCKWVIPNKCPGGADIMHLQYENKCAVVQFGQCPGPSTFVKYVRDY